MLLISRVRVFYSSHLCTSRFGFLPRSLGLSCSGQPGQMVPAAHIIFYWWHSEGEDIASDIHEQESSVSAVAAKSRGHSLLRPLERGMWIHYWCECVCIYIYIYIYIKNTMCMLLFKAKVKGQMIGVLLLHFWPLVFLHLWNDSLSGCQPQDRMTRSLLPRQTSSCMGVMYRCQAIREIHLTSLDCQLGSVGSSCRWTL